MYQDIVGGIGEEDAGYGEEVIGEQNGHTTIGYISTGPRPLTLQDTLFINITRIRVLCTRYGVISVPPTHTDHQHKINK